MFAGPCRDNGTQRGIITDFAGSSLSPHLAHTIVLYGDVPFLEQVSHLPGWPKNSSRFSIPSSGKTQTDFSTNPIPSLGCEGGSQSFFLSLLGLDCFQLKIICMPKISILGWKILLISPKAGERGLRIWTRTKPLGTLHSLSNKDLSWEVHRK